MSTVAEPSTVDGTFRKPTIVMFEFYNPNDNKK